MFEDFLRVYIEDVVTCFHDKEEFWNKLSNEEQERFKQEIVDYFNNNDEFWLSIEQPILDNLYEKMSIEDKDKWCES